MDLGLTGKRALVLGASQGIGLGVARALLGEGAVVTLSSRSMEGLDAARQALPEDQKVRCHLVACDLAAPDAAATIAAGAREHMGGVDILVNNSGGPAAGAPSAVSVADMAAGFEAMVKPIVALTLDLLVAMRERRWGRILTVASSGVVQPIPHLPVSNSLRSSLVAFMKTLAGEVAADGVTVNVLAPGRIATARTQSLDAAIAARTGRPVEEVSRESAATIPTGRYGSVEEFAAVAAFLAGVPASYVTGSLIRVDGGAIRSI